jgi:hypothetical protein
MKRHRYRVDALPGLEEAAAAQEWSPAALPQEQPRQGWLLFSDGAQLGPLFNTSAEEQP